MNKTAIGIAAMIILLGTAFLAANPAILTQSNTGNGEYASSSPEIVFEGTYSLTDHNGEIFTHQGFGDHYKLIFFGFTKCPDICPIEMQKLTKVMEKLGDLSKQIRVAFITIDPAHDTPEILKMYLDLYNPDFIGLTGTKEEIEAVKKIYGAYAEKELGGSSDDYNIAHSSAIYFMAPDNKLLGLYRSGDTPEKIETEVRQTLIN